MLTFEDSTGSVAGIKKKRLILIGGSIILAIIVITAIGFVMFNLRKSDTNDKCKLQTTEIPVVGQADLVRSSDNTSLVLIVAYLKLSSWKNDGPTTNRYLPLKLNEVIPRTANNRSKLELSLEFDCATLALMHESPLVDGDFGITSSRLIPKTTNAGFQLATLRMDNIHFRASEFYSCQLRKEYDCFLQPDFMIVSTDGFDIKKASLVINQIQYEINGNPSLISAGHFSKKEKNCR